MNVFMVMSHITRNAVHVSVGPNRWLGAELFYSDSTGNKQMGAEIFKYHDSGIYRADALLQKQSDGGRTHGPCVPTKSMNRHQNLRNQSALILMLTLSLSASSSYSTELLDVSTVGTEGFSVKGYSPPIMPATVPS